MTAAEMFAEYTHLFLEWVGFGTIIGLVAKGIMPGRDPGGAVATLMMGVGGCVIGVGIFTFFFPDMKVTPLSWVGFLVAVAGAFLILGFYRLLGGYFFTEGETNKHRHSYRRSWWRRRARVADEY